MPTLMRLSELVNEIQDTIESRFEGAAYWINVEITDVKKYADKKWCFLKFIEKEGLSITTEIKGVFWGGTFHHIEKFERQTGQLFSNGLQISCLVRVRFHKRYGLTLEVLEIDLAYALGKLAIEREAVLNRLQKENPEQIQLIDGRFVTFNNLLPLPIVMQRIALITAPASDGQRDFLQELEKNRYGYAFDVREYLVQIQGDQSSGLIREQLQLILTEKVVFDVVIIVRGGGSQTDFKPFDDYELSKDVACFPIPILTGIGHDRNTSIVDLMARANKTPTKAAATVIDHNLSFEQELLSLTDRFFKGVNEILDQKSLALRTLKTDFTIALSLYFKNRKHELDAITRLVKNLSPAMLLTKGFAIVMQQDMIITDPSKIEKQTAIKTILKSTIIHSNVTEKTPYENQPEL
ncbi:MAG: exodeoxyribonuclease VII large subunit [Chitinophagales bacterium]